MKNPIQDLTDEHDGIIQMLLVMDKVTERINSDQMVPKEHLERITEFLKGFADKCHHGKEEDILFPEIGSSHTKTVNELLGEHKTGRDLVRGISESLEKFDLGNPDAYHIARNMQNYTELLMSHIKKENILFGSIMQELPGKLQDEIEERFEKFEREVIGEGKHEEYHNWIKEFKDLYT